MSARMQHVQFVTPPAFAFASAPFFLPAVQSLVPSGQTSARTLPVITAQTGPFTDYPPRSEEEGDDSKLVYTYGSFHEEPIAALSINTCHNDTWTLCIPVEMPEIPNATLLAVNYMITYATTGDNGNSTIQTDVILTTENVPTGVLIEGTGLEVYRRNKTGYGPRTVDHDAALCLSTTLAVKCNGGGEQWSHYVDSQHITPNVRIIDKEARLYVVFHVCEYPTARTIRSLSVEVSATWQKEEVEKKAQQEAAEKAEAERAEAEEKERQRSVRHAEEKAAREAAEAWRCEERRAREEEKEARKELTLAIKAAEEWRNEEKRARVFAAAPDEADAKTQDRIKDILEKNPSLAGGTCTSGYEWKKTATGYKCGGGGHELTFADLNMV